MVDGKELSFPTGKGGEFYLGASDQDVRHDLELEGRESATCRSVEHGDGGDGGWTWEGSPSSSPGKYLAVLLCLFFAGKAGAACSVSATGVKTRRLRHLRDRPAGLDGHGSRSMHTGKQPIDITIAIGPSRNSNSFVPRAECGAPLLTQPAQLQPVRQRGRSTVSGGGRNMGGCWAEQQSEPPGGTTISRVSSSSDISVGYYSTP